MAQKQDFLLRLLEELAGYLAEIRQFRDSGNFDAALLTVLQAQQRLFARPAAEFMTRSLEDQVRLLVVGEREADAREKCLAYATLLTEAGHTYHARGQDSVAAGAHQLALHVLLLIPRPPPGPELAELHARIAAALERLAEVDLSPELKALLDRRTDSGSNR